MTNKNEALQSLCREYLYKLRYMARKHGLDGWLSNIIKQNHNNECKATEHEVELLSRLCNDERVTRTSIPKMLGKSYRQSFEDDDFGKIKKLPRLGIYSKVSTVLYNLKTQKKRGF